MTGRLNFTSGCGSFELKRCYQKNLGLGITFSGLFHIIVVGGLLIYTNIANSFTPTASPPPKTPIEIDISLIPPPPIGHDHTEQIAVSPIIDNFKTIGIPKPVPDTEATIDETFPTQEQLSMMAGRGIKDLLGSETGESIVIKISPEEYLPPSGEYVHREEEPVPINEVKPEYPSLAREAGIEGVVWVEVLVDKNGDVRDARIIKPSGSSAGFEEAAIKAAYQTKWKPALNNNQPVAVRVTYPVYFRLR
jgi:protein TonB